jgi:hypothetical protein
MVTSSPATTLRTGSAMAATFWETRYALLTFLKKRVMEASATGARALEQSLWPEDALVTGPGERLITAPGLILQAR